MSIKQVDATDDGRKVTKSRFVTIVVCLSEQTKSQRIRITKKVHWLLLLAYQDNRGVSEKKDQKDKMRARKQ